jgi:hypothetical protein
MNKTNKKQNEVYEALNNWINEGFCEVQNKHGMKYGDMSPELSDTYEHLVQRLSTVCIQQMKEYGIKIK